MAAPTSVAALAQAGAPPGPVGRAGRVTLPQAGHRWSGVGQAGRVAGHVLAVSVRGLQVEHRHREPLAEQRYRQAAHVSGPAHVQHTHDGFFPTRRMPGCSARTSGAVIPSSAVRP
jgi:hypothetical protein